MNIPLLLFGAFVLLAAFNAGTMTTLQLQHYSLDAAPAERARLVGSWSRSSSGVLPCSSTRRKVSK